MSIPDTVTEIGPFAFFRTPLNRIPDGNIKIGAGAFKCCFCLPDVVRNGVLLHLQKRMEKPVFPDGVTEIGDYVFACWNELTQIVIPEGITTIAPNAFLACRNLQRVVIPSSMERIGYRAFKDCTALTEIVFPDKNIRIGKEAFLKCPGWSELRKRRREMRRAISR